jgi:hypothetical protein
MCSSTTAKYHYGDSSFCYKYEFAQYLKSVGMSNREIAEQVYPGKRFTDRANHNVVMLLSYSPDSEIKTTKATKTTKKSSGKLDKITWSKIEYYSLMVGNASIRVSSDVFSRLTVKEGMLTIE